MKIIVNIGLSSLLFIALVSISACSKSKTPATADMNVPTTGTQNGHDWVDLGLPSGLKWATCNIGATAPEDYGDFYAWGEITPKSEFIWENYKFFIGEDSSENMAFSMYNTDVDYGTVDNKKRLAIADDAARVNWGDSWRMPMDTELQELMAECVWTWTEQAGVYGFKVTSKKNGNSIFFPAAGYCYMSEHAFGGTYGCYWSSSLFAPSPDVSGYLCFSSGEFYQGNDSRYKGHSIRPVTN